MLSKKEIICPEKLLKLAKTKGPVKVVIVNAGKAVSIESAKQAVDENLIDPVFVGDKSTIEKLAKNIKLVKKLPKAKGFSSILYPGERKNKTYRKNLNKDISIPSKILKEINELNAI